MNGKRKPSVDWAFLKDDHGWRTAEGGKAYTAVIAGIRCHVAPDEEGHYDIIVGHIDGGTAPTLKQSKAEAKRIAKTVGIPARMTTGRSAFSKAWNYVRQSVTA